jgi:hypothetical protein
MKIYVQLQSNEHYTFKTKVVQPTNRQIKKALSSSEETQSFDTLLTCPLLGDQHRIKQPVIKNSRYL